MTDSTKRIAELEAELAATSGLEKDLEDALAERDRLQEHDRLRALDIITLGQLAGKLEAERDRMKAAGSQYWQREYVAKLDEAESLRKERDAIEAKTIERCIGVANRWQRNQAKEELIDALRALKQSGERNEPTKMRIVPGGESSIKMECQQCGRVEHFRGDALTSDEHEHGVRCPQCNEERNG